MHLREEREREREARRWTIFDGLCCNWVAVEVSLSLDVVGFIFSPSTCVDSLDFAWDLVMIGREGSHNKSSSKLELPTIVLDLCLLNSRCTLHKEFYDVIREMNLSCMMIHDLRMKYSSYWWIFIRILRSSVACMLAATLFYYLILLSLINHNLSFRYWISMILDALDRWFRNIQFSIL